MKKSTHLSTLLLDNDALILRDGEVIQQGTGQQIVLKPANDYIISFTKDVNRGRSISISMNDIIAGMVPPKAEEAT